MNQESDKSAEDAEYKKKIKTFFDEFAESWDDRFQGTKASLFFKEKRLNMIRRHLGSGYRSVVETGCGTGYYITRILQPGQEGLGVDVSDKMLNRAAALKKDLFPGLNIKFQLDDGENLSLASAGYDRAIFVGYLIHLQNPQKAVNELFRILKPGGRVVGLVSNRWSPWLSLGLRRLAANDYGSLPRDHEFSPPEVRRVFANAGFSQVKLHFFNSLPGKLPNWAYYPGRVLNSVFAVWPISLLGFHIMVVADKADR